MKYPTLNEVNTTRDLIDTFGGYNHNLRINENEFYDMENLTGKYYPVLSPRGRRGIYDYHIVLTLLSGTQPEWEANKYFKWVINGGLGIPVLQTSATAPEDWDAKWNTDYYIENTEITHKPNGLISKDALCYVDGTSLYINKSKVEGLTLTDSPKQLVSMGAYIIILPDKMYVNTADTTDKGRIEADFTTTGTVSFSLCKVDGETYGTVEPSPTAPSNPANMQLWIDTSQTPHILKQYSATSSQWVQIATTYVKISATGIGTSFKQYDGVKITGIDSSVSALSTLASDLNGKTSVIQEVSADYIVVIGMLDTTGSQTGTEFKVSRTMPDMDFVIESGNRLWGCRYGTNADDNVVNEIYASKQGDFKNWNCFMGISTDSYTASVGTDGQFTGAITHLGYPVFFKENYLHKVYGNYPANYQIQSTACKGVQKGAGKSLAIVNETLYYKSRNGVCIYDGSLPTEISANFGEIHYSAVDTESNDIDYILRAGAVAGAHQNKYYISMKSEADNEWYLFIYDTKTGMWHKQDKTHALEFCSCRDELYYIEENKIKTMLGSGTKDSEEVEWAAETGVLGASLIDKKYISKLNVRMSLAIGSRVMFFAEYDSSGSWEHLSTVTGISLRSFTMPIRPKRCDHLRLRIEGIGDAKIYSISKTLEQGSDI